MNTNVYVAHIYLLFMCWPLFFIDYHKIKYFVKLIMFYFCYIFIILLY